MVSLGMLARLHLLATPLQIAKATRPVPGGACLAQLRSHSLIRVASDRKRDQCFGELPGLAVTEGNGVGAAVSAASANECQAACDAQEGCNSFSLCPLWSECYLK